MNQRSINKVKFISLNALRQVLISVFAMLIPFLVIYYSGKEIWGEFVSILLFTLIATQFINWGNKEYLLRTFSETPKEIKNTFSSNLLIRFPLVILFSIIGFFYFKLDFGIYIFLCLFGRFLIHSFEVLVVYEKRFISATVIETVCFLIFTITFYYFKSEIYLKIVLILYSLYQLIKGFCYVLLFRNFIQFKKTTFNFNYYKISFWFFLLSILGFLASKIDVYIIERFGNKIITSDYQIINSLLVFIMSIAAFVYAPFTKNIYRNTDLVIAKTKKTLTYIGLIIIPFSLVIVYLINSFFLNLSLSLWFYIIAFFYIFPSFVYGIDIINLFKQRKEKKVVAILFIGVLINFILTYILFIKGFGFYGSLLGCAIAQLSILLLFTFNQNLTDFIHFQKQRNFYSKLINSDDLCFDVGANIGIKSKIFLSLNANVIAFEPQSLCKEKLDLIKNKNFKYFSWGIGEKNEEKELCLATHIEVASFSKEFIDFYTNEKIKWNKKEIVTIKTLNQIVEEFGVPNYCKIDTEGYELKILSSLNYKIPCIEFEFTESHFDETLKIIDLLDSDKSTFNYILNENLDFKLKKWVSGNELKEQLKILSKNKLHGNIFAKTDV